MVLPKEALKSRRKRLFSKLHTTPSFQKKLNSNKTLALNVYKFIKANSKRIDSKGLIDPKTGAEIIRGHTGTYKGTDGTSTFKVKLNKRSFFVKFGPTITHRGLVDRYKTLEKFVKNINYRCGRYKIDIIRPHLIYETKSTYGDFVLVTDFFEKEQVLHLNYEFSSASNTRPEISAKEYNTLFKTEIEQLKKMGNAFGVEDIQDYNMFFHKKTKTILLFDP